jgi:hypothetical protein
MGVVALYRLFTAPKDQSEENNEDYSEKAAVPETPRLSPRRWTAGNGEVPGTARRGEFIVKTLLRGTEEEDGE